MESDMPTLAYTQDELDSIHARATQGESIRALATERGVDFTALYRLLKRRYRFTGSGAWPSSFTLPDDRSIIGYIAGIFDGEGSLSKRASDGKWIVAIGMTDEGVIRWLAQFGGTFGVTERKAPRQVFYTWRLARLYDVLCFLTHIRPYLIVKRDISTTAITALEDRLCLRHT